MFKIGNINIKNNICLAPMAGVSNPAYMKICEEMGVGYMVTELMSAEAIIRGNKKTFDMLKGINDINVPVAIQIFGSNPDTMAEAADILVNDYDAKIIDINMGCPVPKVAVKSNAGSALLKDIDKVYSIVKKVVDRVNVPVTVKIRSGWDNNSINAADIAKTIEKAGASLICVHGRTRSQGYTGSVNLDVIKMVKENVTIPVIGNGDIRDIESAKKMFSYTGCDAIMIGRAALGNPWIIRELVSYFEDGIIISKPTYEERIDMCFHHFDYLMKTKSERTAILEMRSHIAWYLKGINGSTEVKKEIFKANTRDEIEKILNNYLKKSKNSI